MKVSNNMSVENAFQRSLGITTLSHVKVFGIYAPHMPFFFYHEEELRFLKPLFHFFIEVVIVLFNIIIN